jgi:hypothetical protein
MYLLHDKSGTLLHDRNLDVFSHLYAIFAHQKVYFKVGRFYDKSKKIFTLQSHHRTTEACKNIRTKTLFVITFLFGKLLAPNSQKISISILTIFSFNSDVRKEPNFFIRVRLDQ